MGISAGGGGGGASVAEKVKRYLVAKGYSRTVGGLLRLGMGYIRGIG